MNIKSVIISYLLSLAIFLIIDMIWLTVIAKNIYQKYLGNFITDKVNWTAALIFYFIYIAGVSVFVIYPAVKKNSALNAILFGAIFGIITYATYDLTNLATLKGWPLQIVFIDILWGAIITSIVSFSGFYIVKWLNQ